MQIPERFSFDGYNCSGTEAFTISLYRLSSKARFIDMSFTFDLLPSFLSQIFAGKFSLKKEKISLLIAL